MFYYEAVAGLVLLAGLRFWLGRSRVGFHVFISPSVREAKKLPVWSGRVATGSLEAKGQL